MNTKTIDITNVGLLLLSTALAFILPFELFLFSYAVLGPLHYLTEITWLKKRDYFTTGKRDYIFLVLPCAILSFMVFINTYNALPVVKNLYSFCVSFFGESFFTFSNVMIFTAFFSALAFVLFKDWLYKAVFIIITLSVGFIIKGTQPFLIFFAILLPTIIHVFIFTGLFMIYGALKNRSATGIASAMVFVLCAASFFLWKPVFNFYSISDYASKAIIMDGKGMVNLNAALISFFHLGRISMETVFQSPMGLSVGRFIAFGYTYHYLNWFSKTEVIKWHKVPARWLAAVIALWIFSVALYAYNYKTGLLALYFLSVLHVFLEFPLNYRSVIGIGEELISLSGFRKSAVVKTVPPRRNPRKK